MHATSSHDSRHDPVPAQQAGISEITLRPAPRREPPFDDEAAAAGIIPTTRYDRQLPFPRPEPPAPLFISPRRNGIPDPKPWAHRMMLGVVEASAGRRSIQQLAGMLSPSILAGLRKDFMEGSARRRRHWMQTATVRTVSGCEPADGVAELCATLHTPSRVHAVALRAEIRHGAWRCVRLQIG